MTLPREILRDLSERFEPDLVSANRMLVVAREIEHAGVVRIPQECAEPLAHVAGIAAEILVTSDAATGPDELQRAARRSCR